MGPPPRSFAADAHDCIMVWVLEPTEYKVVARLISAPERGLPSDRYPDPIEQATVLGAVKVWPGKCRARGTTPSRTSRHKAIRFWPSPTACDGLPMTVRGGGVPACVMAHRR